MLQLQYERYYVGDPVRILARTFLAYDACEIPSAEQEPLTATASNLEEAVIITNGYLLPSQQRLPASSPIRRLRILPLTLVWPGFAINSAFYAAVSLLPFGPFALRRFIRTKRGLCPKCAYPVGESAVCTECGQELAT